MKCVLVATDLSAEGNSAARFAAHLAARQDAALHLLTVYRFWPQRVEEVGEDAPENTAQVEEEKKRVALRALADELKSTYGEERPIGCRVAQGYVVPTVQEVARSLQADLIVKSTVGSSEKPARQMGSAARAAVAETEVPLLLVPPAARYSPIDNVLLGIDLDALPSAGVFDKIIRFAEEFGSVVNVLSVHDKPASMHIQKRAELIRRLLLEVPHTLTLRTGERVLEALLGFAHTDKADLIMMVPQSHGWLHKLLLEGNTQKLARLTDVPLLVVV